MAIVTVAIIQGVPYDDMAINEKLEFRLKRTDRMLFEHISYGGSGYYIG